MDTSEPLSFEHEEKKYLEWHDGPQRIRFRWADCIEFTQMKPEGSLGIIKSIYEDLDGVWIKVFLCYRVDDILDFIIKQEKIEKNGESDKSEKILVLLQKNTNVEIKETLQKLHTCNPKELFWSDRSFIISVISISRKLMLYEKTSELIDPATNDYLFPVRRFNRKDLWIEEEKPPMLSFTKKLLARYNKIQLSVTTKKN